ncbi:MAG: hypothetical protein QE263_02795 [Vampirovibrionales bacterium]|nr:hypothetical protein [Vampirovibrionales bacterium]
MRFSVVRCIALATWFLWFGFGTLNQAPASANDMAPDTDWMLRKGFSSELITTTRTQRYRQEWRVPPAPLRTPKQQMWRNVVINDPIGNIDPFGSYQIREKQ